METVEIKTIDREPYIMLKDSNQLRNNEITIHAVDVDDKINLLICAYNRDVLDNGGDKFLTQISIPQHEIGKITKALLEMQGLTLGKMIENKLG